MYIERIQIVKFRHIENVTIGPFTQNSKASEVLVLAGPNGGGKSSILELMGYALSNSWSLSWVLNRTFDGFSFEVSIGLTPEEKETVVLYLKENAINYIDEVLKYLDSNNNIYYRGFNYPEGEYQKDAALYNKIHGIVSIVLKEKYKRSLGFFLKADRVYPSKNFDRNKIFNYNNTTKIEHLWSIAYNTSEAQYQDMYDYLVQSRFHYLRELGSYHHFLKTAKPSSPAPSDPLLPYDKLLSDLFPGYSFVDKEEIAPTNLFVKIPSGETIPFHDLSSGEKEVFFLLSFFLRNDVRNSVIVIDEPELHLHPELARQLVRQMIKIKKGNQIWLATHNSEIIDEAGRDKVLYVSRDIGTRKSKVVSGLDEESAISQLKTFFGFSGYVGVAKKLIFLEGIKSSTDRKLFVNLFPEHANKIKFIPSNSSENISRINAAIISILESNLGWIDFYLIRDRDYFTKEQIDKYNSHPSGKIKVLERHEIENYLLNEKIITQVLKDYYGIEKTPIDLISLFKNICSKMSSDVLRDCLSFRMNLLYRPEDFSLGKLLNSQPLVDNKGNVDEERKKIVGKFLNKKILEISESLNKRTEPSEVQSLIESTLSDIQKSISENNDFWKYFYPGKELIENLCKELEIKDYVPFQNILIKEIGTDPKNIPEDLIKLITDIANDKTMVDFTLPKAEIDVVKSTEVL